MLVTRSPEQSLELGEKLLAFGALPIYLPTIRFTQLSSAPLRAALRRIDQYDWLVFTSGNATRFFFSMLDDLTMGSVAAVDVHAIMACMDRGLRVAVVGPATAERLRVRGIRVDVLPPSYTGASLVIALGDVDGRRILLPRARHGRPELTMRLRRAGALVDDVAIYETSMAEPDDDALATLGPGIDAMVFTSPSSVRNALLLLRRTLPTRHSALLRGAAVACIGPTTAAAAEREGLEVDVVPEQHTIDDLVAALSAHMENHEDDT